MKPSAPRNDPFSNGKASRLKYIPRAVLRQSGRIPESSARPIAREQGILAKAQWTATQKIYIERNQNHENSA